MIDSHIEHPVWEDNTTLQRGDTVKVPRLGGVAWWVEGPCDLVTLECDGHEDPDSGELYDCGGCVEVPEHYDCYLVRMVGDDGVQHYDITDLTPIDDESFCGGCGQIGCGHG